MFDFISEMASSFKWVYRGWLYIILPSYRKSVKAEHLNRGTNWKRLDFFMSSLFLCLEAVLIIYIARSF